MSVIIELQARQSSFLPSLLQRWAKAASFLHGVGCRYSTFQQLLSCLAAESAPTAQSMR